MSKAEWIAEAKRYAQHIFCYSGLIDDFKDSVERAYDAGENVYKFVAALGEKYDLDRADESWGIHSGVDFEKKPEFQV